MDEDIEQRIKVYLPRLRNYESQIAFIYARKIAELGDKGIVALLEVLQQGRIGTWGQYAAAVAVLEATGDEFLQLLRDILSTTADAGTKMAIEMALRPLDDTSTD